MLFLILEGMLEIDNESRFTSEQCNDLMSRIKLLNDN